MIEKLLHTPEGVRDIYNAECERKLQLQNRLHHVMKLHGFKDIQTPTFEFFDIFSKERGTVAAKDMYKFFDRDGNTLVLRPDITPSIARCAAKYYKEESFPIRLSYMGSTFINNSSYQGKLKESTQLGAELINDSSTDADAEMLALTIECLLEAGLKEFQVEIGEADFFRGLVEEAGFDEEEEYQLRILIEKKNMFGVEELISSKEISSELKHVFLTLPELFGTIDKLISAKSLTTNLRALKAIERLEQLYTILTAYGLEKYITFDLGMLSKYNYYTGIIFRAYTYGTGDTIANGGRYDNLVGQFGKDAPAIGLAIMVDQLMLALSRQKIEIKPETENTLILYHHNLLENAIALANHFRNQGMNIELLRVRDNTSLEEYIAYSKRNGNGGILYYETAELIKVINSESSEIQEANIKDLIR
ncbi:ATP phosphoribosyltransferase regulatory subunit [Anaerocolumna sedimenticola]|uniref:ATP phosphoribosyltransferase regulatory subunit n=1 Tax=Anaerocolumna sedimenticola TaxID=2696063 RepID=A0A6P1TPK7_9FIRM|nr:ATP phosphoribosyltransferase regulatory subunit [Anaerocolumna sedimenticola]QHQ62122.1 ATP phosphoribosyltransferase regulatory subunit [Anaerocolumna sedimenticola]